MLMLSLGGPFIWSPVHVGSPRPQRAADLPLIGTCLEVLLSSDQAISLQSQPSRFR